MFNSIQLITLIEFFFWSMLSSKVIFKIIRDPDDICFAISRRERVKPEGDNNKRAS